MLKQIGTQHRTFTAKMLLVPTNFSLAARLCSALGENLLIRIIISDFLLVRECDGFLRFLSRDNYHLQTLLRFSLPGLEGTTDEYTYIKALLYFEINLPVTLWTLISSGAFWRLFILKIMSCHGETGTQSLCTEPPPIRFFERRGGLYTGY